MTTTSYETFKPKKVIVREGREPDWVWNLLNLGSLA